jgi:23S rRNA pseudouridine2605 synthase
MKRTPRTRREGGSTRSERGSSNSRPRTNFSDRPKRRDNDEGDSENKRSYNKRSSGDREEKSGRFGDKKKSFGERGEKSGGYGDKRKSYGDREGKSSYGDRKKSYGDREEKSSYGDRKKSYGDREEKSSYGDRKKSYGDREEKSSYGDRKKSYGDREGKSSYGDRKKSYGDREGKSSYGDRKKSYGDREEKSSYGDRKKSFGDHDGKSSYGDRKKSFGDREGKSSYSDRKKSYGDREEKGSYGDRKKTFGNSEGESTERKKNFAPRGRAKTSYIDKEFKDDDNFDFKEYKNDKKRGQKSKTDYTRITKRPRKKSGDSKPQPNDEGMIRLNKFIANTGVCSRREADELISTGVISVNGKVVTELGTKIYPTDKVQYGEQTLAQEKLVYLLLNKPKDYITTVDDPEKRNTVMELVDNATKERIYPVGRLDRNTTGLLLFTNDGELTLKLTHPKNGIKKIYHVMVDQNFKAEDMKKMREGFELEDGYIKVDDIQFVGDSGNKKDIGVEIHSGKNRIVRRMFEALGYKVVKLDRVMFAGLTKKDLSRGKWRFLTPKEVNFLKML